MITLGLPSSTNCGNHALFLLTSWGHFFWIESLQMEHNNQLSTSFARYERQMLLPEIGTEGQQLLHNARVLIVGAGGLGCPIAMCLAGAGIGTLGLVDNDTVSVNNLHRQVLYTEKQVGLPKATEAARRLGEMNSEVCIEAHAVRLSADNAATLIAQYDMVVDGCDNYQTRYLIDRVCRAQGKPYVYGAVEGWCGQVSVFHVGPQACSYAELFPEAPQPSDNPLKGKEITATVTGCIGNIMAQQVIQLICRCGHPLVNRLWSIDLRTLECLTMNLR